MRKILLTITALIAAYLPVFAQDVFIQYDVACFDKMEYRYAEQPNSAPYTVYRYNVNTGEKLFFETGIENVIVRKSPPGNLVKCTQNSLSKEAIVNLINGNQKVFVVKKLDSGWAYLPVGSVTQMQIGNNNLTYRAATFDIETTLTQPQSGMDLTAQKDRAKHYMYYMGDMNACNNRALLFQKVAYDACTDDATIAIIPSVGLIQERVGNKIFELVSINGRTLCESQTPSTVATSEPRPETVPQQYAARPLPKPVPQQNSTQPSVASVPEQYIARPVREAPSIVADVFESVETTPPSVDNALSQSTYTSSEFEIGTKSVVHPATTATTNCDIIAKNGEHVVQPAESVYSIARRYGLSVAQLREWNNLSSDLIYECSILKIMAPPAAAKDIPSMTLARINNVPTAYGEPETNQVKLVNEPPQNDCNLNVNEGEHAVQKGEGLFAIARKYGVSVNQIREWNNLQNDVIYPCSILKIAAPKAKTVATKVVPKSYSTVVKPTQKETVTTKSVAKNTKVSPQPKTTKLAAATDAKVKAVSVKKGTGLHVVQKDETVATLAKKFKMSEKEFRVLNKLTATEKVEIGQVVKIEDCNCKSTEYPSLTEGGTQKAISAESVPSSYNTVAMPKPVKVKSEEVTTKGIESRSRKYHVVQPDETLRMIADRYKIDVEKLRKLNNLEPNEMVIPNQVLSLE